VRHWAERTEICYEQLLRWIQLSSRKFRDWRTRYGKANEHNHLVPRDRKLEAAREARRQRRANPEFSL